VNLQRALISYEPGMIMPTVVGTGLVALDVIISEGASGMRPWSY
jgi:hypothetical protein